LFDWFLEEYEEQKKLTKAKFHWYERVSMGLLLFSYIALVFSVFSTSTSLWFPLAYAVALLLFLLLILLRVKVDKRLKKDKILNYKEKNIDLIEDLMKKDRYKLYSEVGVNYLIQCCQAKVEENFIQHLLSSAAKFFTIAILPVVIFIISRIIELWLVHGMSNYHDVSGYTETIFNMFIGFLMLGIIIVIIREVLLQMDIGIAKYKALQKDLEYIKTQICHEDGIKTKSS